MFGYESPLTYVDRLDKLNKLPLLYSRDISDLSQLYKSIQDPCSLSPESIDIRNDQRCTRQLNHQIFQYHYVKISDLDNFILTELYIV